MTPEQFESIRQLMQRRSGVTLAGDKRTFVETRLDRVRRARGLASVAELAAALPRNAELQSTIVEALLVGETSFFRNMEVFEALAESTLPELIARRQSERRIDIWSAACASGQEAYSLAMLLHDRFPQLADWNIRLLASDLSARFLRKARAGRYTQMEIQRGLPAQMAVRYFQPRGREWQISDELQAMVEFSKMDLFAARPAPPPMDIILLRNVLIYFDVETRARLLRSVRRWLADDGVLFVGATETMLGLDTGFDRVELGGAVCYRCAPDSAAGGTA